MKVQQEEVYEVIDNLGEEEQARTNTTTASLINFIKGNSM